ncbi:MmgE/PrpD family protein [Alcaligenaceae bacterium]|nr:MmgE/PrpD family protein [Alcaligenaceae bacterium]
MQEELVSRRRQAGQQWFLNVGVSAPVMPPAGDLSFVGFNDAVLQNLLACDLEKRVQVVHEPAFTKRFPLERPARVTIYTRDGREHVNERSFRRGDPESPWSWEELQARFISIASLAQLSDSSSAEVVSWCFDLASRGATSPIDPVLPFASSLPSI